MIKKDSQNINIAIDVTSIPLKPTGIGNYILNLTEALGKLSFKENTFLYVFGRDDQKDFSEFSNVNFVNCGHLSPSKRIIWEQLVFPFLLGKYKISLLHSPNYTIPLFAPCKRISTIHDLTCFIYPERRPGIHGFYYRLMMKITARFADRIISVSENTKKDIQKFLKPLKCPIDIIYEGCSPIFKKPKEDVIKSILMKYNISNPYFIFVSTIEPSKNVLRLITAFKKFHEKSPNSTQLLLIGKLGWEYEVIFKEIEKLPKKIVIKHLNYIPNNELASLYSGSISLVYPSLYEGFGIPPLEAMSCGTPVMCSNTSSIPEVTGNAAILFNPENIDEIADSFLHIYSDNQLRIELIEKGFERIKLFKWDNIALDIYNCYSELLS